jgi:hypothetical protein
MKGMTTQAESVVTLQPTACDNTLQQSTAEEASASADVRPTSFPTATNNKALESSDGFADLDYLDGPTIIAEVYPFIYTRVSILTGVQQPLEPYETVNTSTTPKVSGCSLPPQY